MEGQGGEREWGERERERERCMKSIEGGKRQRRKVG
jgi:hypothetical protein